METQTAVLQFIVSQNHNNSNRSSSTSHVNNNTTKDTQPIHESHSLKQQQQQHQTEESFSEEDFLPWEKVTTKQRNDRNQSIEKTKLFIGNLNQSKTEKDLNEMFGIECTPYLRETCSIEMPKNKHTGQSKGFAFLNVPAHVRDEIIKLDGIEYKNQTIKIEKARTQYLSKPHEATITPSLVDNKNPENQDVFIQNIVPFNKSYAQAKVPSNSARTSNNVVIFGDSIVNFSTKLKYNINRALTNGRATIPHINSETSPLPPIINVVCKYLRQFLGTSFGIATLPIYCNIE